MGGWLCADFDDLVVASRNGSPVRIRDIGRAEDGTKEQRSIARSTASHRSLEVRAIGTNTVAVIEGVKRPSRGSRAATADVRVESSATSRATSTRRSTRSSFTRLGASWPARVLLFMRDGRATIIAATPFHVGHRHLRVMKALGFTLNSVTMLALVLMSASSSTTPSWCSRTSSAS